MVNEEGFAQGINPPQIDVISTCTAIPLKTITVTWSCFNLLFTAWTPEK